MEAGEIAARKAATEAICNACGMNWKFNEVYVPAEENKFCCPNCHNEPERLDFRSTLALLADEVSQRWTGQRPSRSG